MLEPDYRCLVLTKRRATVAIGPNPLGLCHFAIGEHEQAIELFQWRCNAATATPRYKWDALLAFAPYLLRQYDLDCRGPAKPHTLIPITSRCSRSEPQRWRKWDRRMKPQTRPRHPGSFKWISFHNCRPAPAKFPLEKPGRHCPLPRGAFESGGPLGLIQSIGFACKRAIAGRSRTSWDETHASISKNCAPRFACVESTLNRIQPKAPPQRGRVTPSSF